MRTSDTINELAAALSAAQGEINNPAKNAKNPHFKSQYADLGEVLSTVRPIFAAHGLSVIQMPSTTDQREVALTTRIMHSSGQWIEDTISLPIAGRNPAQDAGTVITYLRRYSLAAAAGVHQADDDAQSITVDRVTSKQAADLAALAEEVDADMEKFCGHLGVAKLTELPADRYSYAVQALEQKRKAA